MPKYLTVAQYRGADEGLPSVSANTPPDTTVAAFIQRSEAQIDSYMGFDPMLGGFEPHQTWFQQPFNMKNLRTRIPNWPVPVRQVLRYRIQISNQSGTGQPFVATIQPSDCTFNLFGGYIEIVPLQAVTYSLVPAIVELGLRPPIVQVDYEAGWFLPVKGEVLSTSNYQTYTASRGFWATSYTAAPSIQPNTLPPIPPVVYNNGATVLSGYTLDTVNGTVTFATPFTAPYPTITLDYTYTIPDFVGLATVAQTTWLLGQRELNLQGMHGLETTRNLNTQLSRRGASSIGEGGLCDDALEMLEPFKQIPLM